MIERETKDGIVTLRLAYGKASVLDLEFLERIEQELASCSDAAAVILTGSGSIFSAGVDLFRLTSGEADYIPRFIDALDRVFLAVLNFPRPLVAAVNGHAIAGGCILAACSDYRLMAEGKGRIGVPELLVGVPFPALALEIMRAAVSPSAFARLALTGETLLPEEALAAGLVDEVTPPDTLLQRAEAVARHLGAIPREAFALTKAEVRAPVRERAERYARQWGEEVHKVWLEPATHANIRAYLDRTVKKSS